MSFWHSIYSNYKSFNYMYVWFTSCSYLLLFIFYHQKIFPFFYTNIFPNISFLPSSILSVRLCFHALIKGGKKKAFQSLFSFHTSRKFYMRCCKLNSLQEICRWYKWESGPTKYISVGSGFVGTLESKEHKPRLKWVAAISLIFSGLCDFFPT